MRNGVITLGLLVALALGVVADATRTPGQQISVRAYVAGVGLYHACIHPVTGHFVRCRFRPTCSNYSRVSVERFGIVRGLRLTIHRVWSCRPSVSPGTPDPVPVR